jgi:hypothetical protein
MDNELSGYFQKLDKRLKDFQTMYEYYENTTKSFMAESSKPQMVYFKSSNFYD